MSLAVGVDAGGTSTRAWVVDAAGHVVGTGTAGGANPNSHPPESAAKAMTEAISTAMASSDPSEVRAWVIGMAGRSKLTDPAIAAVFEREWDALGFEHVRRPTLVSDAVAAFVSATAEPDGTVLVAGTGSIAGRIRAREMVSTVGGYGWLLGDEGSGFWLGRQAVRVALDVLAGQRPPSRLADAVLRQAGVDRRSGGDSDAAFRLITAVNAEAPVNLARYAPLVSAAHAEGDAAAVAIVDEAATLLTETALAARDEGETTPVVLVGSVLGPTSPVGERVRTALRAATSAPVLGSDNGALGAAWLAALDAFGPDAPRPTPGTVD
ncbi:N-acetylglucosamine kinase [Saccharomonospora sp. NB11]|jgi:glucosamine kinase|uniref:N-acetylglucosamine kinase n=1 Tax=Saccharomonospora sp. NB11 TaxID=1642298 RepID=UPI0018D0A43D|nr:BadF/BadG/BcrA/BcrD ATPase family protein [Saccharomonospora sp. NB11]